jgi:hypothetical protein
MKSHLKKIGKNEFEFHGQKVQVLKGNGTHSYGVLLFENSLMVGEFVSVFEALKAVCKKLNFE